MINNKLWGVVSTFGAVNQHPDCSIAIWFTLIDETEAQMLPVRASEYIKNSTRVQ